MNINKKIRSVLTACLLSSFSIFSSFADTLEFENGDRITGTLSGVAGRIVEFETEYAGLLRVRQDAITNLNTSARFLLIDQNGERREGEILRETDLSKIHSAWRIKDSSENLEALWDNNLSLSASYSHGNSTTQVYLLTTETQITRQQSEHEFTSSIHHDTAEGESLKNQYEIGYKMRRYLNDKWFYLGNLDAYRDPLKSIDLRLSPSVGVGHRFWENSYGKLLVEAGGAVVLEDIGVEKREDPALSWALDFSRRLFGGRTEAFHEHSILTTGVDGFVFDSSSGFNVAFSEWVDLNLLAKIKFDTTVPDDVESVDVVYVAGIGLNF